MVMKDLNNPKKIYDGYPDNHQRFPSNFFLPEKISVDDYTYKLYKVRFNSLTSLYDILKSNPPVNGNVFRELSSVTGDYDFAGKPYPDAVEDLVGTIDPGYEEFLKLQSDLNSATKGAVHKYQLVRTVAGGHLSIPAYSSGAPLCYETEERISKPKFVKIHVSLSYYWGTSKRQVLNRAIIITNILRALEKAGYSVDLNTFEMSSCSNEIIYFVVQIKKPGERLNMSRLYKTLCHVEFLRRLLFRVLELTNVECSWGHGYGSTCDESMVRKVLKAGKNDIFFDQPRNMGIEGNSLADDFERAIRHLNLEDKIDVEKAKKEFREDVMSLRKKK